MIEALAIGGVVAWNGLVVWWFARLPLGPAPPEPPERPDTRPKVRRWKGEKPDDVVAVYSDLW